MILASSGPSSLEYLIPTEYFLCGRPWFNCILKMCKYSYYPQITNEEIEAHRGKVIYLRTELGEFKAISL